MAYMTAKEHLFAVTAVVTSTALPQNRNIPSPSGSTFSAVYILNKQPRENQKLIEVPAPPPSEPEVYFINYSEGENPILPNGIDLQTALNAAIQGSTAIVDLDKGAKENDGEIVAAFESTKIGASSSFIGNKGSSSSSNLEGNGNIGENNVFTVGKGDIRSRFGIGATGGVEGTGTTASDSGVASSVGSSGNGVSEVSGFIDGVDTDVIESSIAIEDDFSLRSTAFGSSGNENNRSTSRIPRLYGAP
ncbi:uncharacterized protein LOC134770677 [Penaeus indicus]|uniref:uncharacterized protein LOC134770677 n=1 Tax=Penaeus indicus TaxID=29960 RepID=UPI00300C99AD